MGDQTWLRDRTLVHRRAGGLDVHAFDGDRLTLETQIEIEDDDVILDIAIAPLEILGRDRRDQSLWSWSAHTGRVQLLAGHPRVIATAGFIEHAGARLRLIANQEQIAITGAAGLIATCRLATPHAWRAHCFVALDTSRVALLGNLFGDPIDMILTVEIETLLHDEASVQHAIERGAPVHDRADILIIGPGPGRSAVVARDPGDEEPPEDRHEGTADVWGLRGYYVRDLDTGALIESRELELPLQKLSPIVATDSAVVFGARGQLYSVDRTTGALTDVGAGALCVRGRTIAVRSGATWTIREI